MFNAINQNTIYTPHMVFLHNRGLITDNISICDYTTAIKASELYLTLDQYKHLYYVPEDTFSEYIKKNQINSIYLYFTIDFARKWN